MKNKILLALLTSLLSSTIYASGTCNINTCVGKLTRLFVHENTNVYMNIDADMSALDCLPPTSGAGFVLRQNNPLQKELYSALLSSYMNQSTIKLRAAVREELNQPRVESQICELRYIIMDTSY